MFQYYIIIIIIIIIEVLNRLLISRPIAIGEKGFQTAIYADNYRYPNSRGAPIVRVHSLNRVAMMK